jgi:hypothetical protein
MPAPRATRATWAIAWRASQASSRMWQEPLSVHRVMAMGIAVLGSPRAPATQALVLYPGTALHVCLERSRWRDPGRAQSVGLARIPMCRGHSNARCATQAHTRAQRARPPSRIAPGVLPASTRQRRARPRQPPASIAWPANILKQQAEHRRMIVKIVRRAPFLRQEELVRRQYAPRVQQASTRGLWAMTQKASVSRVWLGNIY